MEIRRHETRLHLGCRLPESLAAEIKGIASDAGATVTEVMEALVRDGLAVRKRLLKSKTAAGR